MDLAAFLDRVIAPGNWIAIMYRGSSPGMKHKFYERDDVGSAARFIAARATKVDTWFAPASFKAAGRTQANVDKLKTLWLDVDIQRPGDGKDLTKAFASEIDAVQWVNGFTRATGIPRPNLWVKSGYGLHLYWTYKDALDRAQWLPYAEALKGALVAHEFPGDINVVADSARVLRPIETWNYKVPDHPVACYEFRPDRLAAPDFDNESLDVLARLPQHKPLGSPPRPATTGSGSLAAARAGLTSQPADFEQISTGCAQVGKSLAAGGVGDSRDLWWTLITLSTFCANGKYWAHKIGEQDPRYTTPAQTDTEYDRAVADRARKDLGAPKCTTLDAARPGICPACPHYQSATITSPYGLGLHAPTMAGSADPDEPPNGFQRDADGIERLVVDKKGRERWVRALDGTISNLRLDKLEGGVLKLTFDYSSPGGRQCVVALANDELEQRMVGPNLNRRGIHTLPSYESHTRQLIMSWIGKLEREMRARADPAPSFGWYKSKHADNTYLGFAVGGTCYHTSGAEETVRSDDHGVLKSYEPVGTLAGWQTAAAFIAADVPELHTAIAASFGAALMEFTGEAAGTVSFVGKTSIGKSSAFKAGATVWGRFLSTTLQLNDTPTYKNLLTSTAQSLPIYWDEVRVTDPDQLIRELHILTQGRDKGRGTADVKMRAPGEWTTLSVLSSNESLCDVVADKCGCHDPTFLRILEIEITREPIQYDVNAAPLVKTLEWNHGVAGRQYARYIADNVPLIQEAIKRERARIAAQTAALDNEERFYLAIAAAILVGAAIAKRLGIIDLDRAGIEKVLCDAIVKARHVRHGYTPPAPGDRLSRLLDEYLRDYGQDMVVTRFMAGRGPMPAAASRSSFLVRSPPGIMRTGNLAYHMSIDDQWLRISRDHWRLWARKKGLSPSGLYSEMSKLWGLSEGRGHLGGGTIHSHRTYYYEMSLNHPDLIALLDEFSTTGSTGKIVPLRP